LSVGERHFYTKFNNNGNRRRIAQNFTDAKRDDIIITYESTPEKKIVALLKLTEETDDQNLYFEKIEHFIHPIHYHDFSNIEELQSMEFLVNPNGSLFKLNNNEYAMIMDFIREENTAAVTQNEPYTKDDLIADVFIEESQYDTLVSLIKSKKNIILQGPPGVGKTYLAKKLAYSIIGSIDESRVEMIQFHQNYAYEDFVRGYKPNETGFEIENGIFYNLCKKAENDIANKYFLIIDEINRANISKVFGELLMLIENNYRNHKIKLSYGGILFSVPENLYIMGLMNTADRSLALIDYALRRRFSFYNMTPAFNTDSFKLYIKSLDDELLTHLIEVIKALNIDIKNDSSLGSGFEVGHSYFSNLMQYTDNYLIEVIEYDIIPLIEEYWFDDERKVLDWSSRLRGVFND
jgi:5-methylcytosine-specific restriction protein B